jgi:hypothetical protein
MEDRPSRIEEGPAKDWSARFKASELKHLDSRWDVLLVLPLVGSWCVELLVMLFAVLAYLKAKAGGLTKL